MAKNRDMMAKIGQAMAQVQKAQEELAQKTAEGTAGGGMVHVVVTGGLKIESLKIEKDAVDPEDVEMLEDLVTAALNEALAKVQQMQYGQLAGIAGNILPGLAG
jgi:DNA-binding YbaB/EbfC family protein